MSNLNWIFFDMGWTLVDETEAHRVRLQRVRTMLAEWDIHYSIGELFELCERSASDFARSPFRDMLTHLGLTPKQVAAIRESATYAKEKEILYPHVTEILATLSIQYKLGIIANQSVGTEDRLVRLGIRELFSIVFASAEYGFEKPDPQIFAGAMTEAQCSPEKILMVGDRLDNDIAPAKLQGWRTVRVLQGFSRYQTPQLKEQKPDITISNIGELPNSSYI